MVDPTPIMFLTPEHDYISPTQSQIEIFGRLTGPKYQHLALGREHVNVLMGEDMPMLAKKQTDWIWSVVRGRYRKANGQAKAQPEDVDDD